MDALARREYARGELESRLTGNGFEAGTVATVLDDLAREGLQSDARFCESFVSSYARRGKGPVRIRHELARRGLADELIGSALDRCGQDWSGLAAEVRRQKFGRTVPADFPSRARQMRFLQYRGFDADQIAAAFDDQAPVD